MDLLGFTAQPSDLACGSSSPFLITNTRQDAVACALPCRLAGGGAVLFLPDRWVVARKQINIKGSSFIAITGGLDS
jgi:hypothetical protein